jgi:hypothetical protein
MPLKYTDHARSNCRAGEQPGNADDKQRCEAENSGISPCESYDTENYDPKTEQKFHSGRSDTDFYGFVSVLQKKSLENGPEQIIMGH